MDTPITPQKNFKPIIGLIALIIIAFLVFIYMQSKEETFVEDGYILGLAEVNNGVVEINSRAVIVPRESVYLDLPLEGIVEKINIEEGRRVKEGDLLIEMSNSQLLLDLISREALVTEQLNSLNNLELTIEDTRLRLEVDRREIRNRVRENNRKINQLRELVSQQLVAQEELDILVEENEHQKKLLELAEKREDVDKVLRKRQLTQLKERSNRLLENLATTRQVLESLNIKAPVDGFVTGIDIFKGQYLSRGTRLGRIDIEGTEVVEAFIDEFYFNQIENGQNATLNILNTEYELKISKVFSEIEESKFKVHFDFISNKPLNVVRGQGGNVRITYTSTKNSVVVKDDGWFKSTGGNWILRKDGDKLTKVNLSGTEKVGAYIVIDNGLDVGDEVVISAYGI
ncbi:HlyD family efflux transporter periplasmic adaptor subunit [Alteromonadaceae bacterium M269]|nr:HlyD family efflux transporter periplasmic adaptor subunit [Alteromonadaceae bacterium M269]